MSYLALYRKYRPQTFDEVVGQDSITRILKNQIKYNRVGHAYLFSGIRGTGKTSLAKIFAKAINCPNSIDGNPCNHCEVCIKIDQPGVMDIIEIDGASNRGVDEIREIRERIKYPPTVGKYKVYIIDEVHMLTKEAFNALLKTLEEPPEHAVFILATTEPNKCPVTILSRCQRYEIRPISKALIIGQMKKICMDIGIDISEEGLDFIASRAENSMRDALSLLDQIIDLKDDAGYVSFDDLLNFTGMVDKKNINDLIKKIISGDSAGVIRGLRELVGKGKDSSLLMDQLIEYMRGILITKTTKELAKEILLCTPEDYLSFYELGEQLTYEQLYLMISQLIEEKNKLKYSSLQGIIVEMALLKLCLGDEVVVADKTFQATLQKKDVKSAIPVEVPSTEINVHQDREDRGNLKSDGINLSPKDDKVNESSEERLLAQEATNFPEEKSDEAQPIQTKQKVKTSDFSKHDEMKYYKLLCDEISTTNSGQAMFLKRGEPSLEADGHLSIIYSIENINFYQFVNKPELVKNFEAILSQKTGKKISVSIKLEEENFAELDLIEKTMRIVNDDTVKIIKSEDEVKK